MATLTNVFGKFFARSAEHAEATSPGSSAADTRVRTFANEDIYFFVKHIDNSAVVRQADPADVRASWSMVATAAMAAVLVIVILMPKGYGVLAGYQIQTLRAENQRLASEQNSLELAEAKLMSTERMAELAKMQQFIDPAPERVVYMDTASDTEFAAVTK